MWKLILLILGAATALWWTRRWVFMPWARYKSHTKTKSGGTFLTVTHVHWWPPFLDFERTYYRDGAECATPSCWMHEETGKIYRYSSTKDNHHDHLSAVLIAAMARKEELEDLLGDL